MAPRSCPTSPIVWKEKPFINTMTWDGEGLPGQSSTGDVVHHIAPNRTMLSERGPAFNYWDIPSFLWVFHKLYSFKNCSSSCSGVHFHLQGQA